MPIPTVLILPRPGLVAPETIRNAVWRSMFLRMKLGDFDPPELVSYQNIGPDHLNTPENIVCDCAIVSGS